MKISFLGAADGVTGSRHLVEAGGTRLLLDCGMFQGLKLHRLRNWAVPPALLGIDAVVLSHAHLDHSGWLPALVKHGFGGPIHASPATCDVAALLLRDSAHLQEEDARRANRYGTSRHEKALPLYSRADAERAIGQFRPLAPGRTVGIGGFQASLHPVGHLLGACAVAVQHGDERLFFSGDVGRSQDLLMPPPQPPQATDTMIVESTYGNRDHAAEDAAPRLAEIINRTVTRGGSVLMPAFAVGRAQALLLVLQRLKRAGAIPDRLPIFVDSPMANQATALYLRHGRLLRVAPRELRTLSEGVRAIETVQQSLRLARSRYPAVVIAASGMATGGRVLNHLEAMAPEPRHSIVLAGFQAAGTRGARLAAGEHEIKLHGRFVPVNAEVQQLEGFSGHADRVELLAWLGTLPKAPRQTWVVHGEAAAADALRAEIQRRLGWAARVPEYGQTVET